LHLFLKKNCHWCLLISTIYNLWNDQFNHMLQFFFSGRDNIEIFFLRILSLLMTTIKQTCLKSKYHFSRNFKVSCSQNIILTLYIYDSTKNINILISWRLWNASQTMETWFQTLGTTIPAMIILAHLFSIKGQKKEEGNAISYETESTVKYELHYMMVCIPPNATFFVSIFILK